MTESVQTEVLEKFKNGQYKVVVCTSVGTEGIDVPDCNIVINYNYSGDEISKIQMKGCFFFICCINKFKYVADISNIIFSVFNCSNIFILYLS